MISPMTPEELLEELAPRREHYASYAELEEALSAVMRQHHDRISAHVSADDVLHYAAQHGLVRRAGTELVIAAGRTATAA